VTRHEEAKRERRRAERDAGTAGTCWIVTGRTGEYSDRSEWVARVFDTEAAAIDYRERLLTLVRERRAEWDGRASYEERDALTEELRASLDPLAHSIDYTGIDYVISRAPFGAGAW
jgi:hypothetical protein